MQTCLSKQPLKTKVPWFHQLVSWWNQHCLNHVASTIRQPCLTKVPGLSTFWLVAWTCLLTASLFFSTLKVFCNVLKLSAREDAKPHLLHLFIFSTLCFSKFIFIAKVNQNHIGWICLTFPHCIFTNVFSNLLLERMHSSIDCIFWLSTLHVLNCLRTLPGTLDTKSHSVAFIWLFSNIYRF